ncbi:MAG TPA: hypothetical protein V6C95_17035, partial [Coleofasciculaceae cyanobacterium]
LKAEACKNQDLRTQPVLQRQNGAFSFSNKAHNNKISFQFVSPNSLRNDDLQPLNGRLGGGIWSNLVKAKFHVKGKQDNEDFKTSSTNER